MVQNHLSSFDWKTKYGETILFSPASLLPHLRAILFPCESASRPSPSFIRSSPTSTITSDEEGRSELPERHQLISFSLPFLLHEPAAPAFTITTTLQPDDHHHLPTLISQSTARLKPTAAVIDSSFSRSTLVDVWCLVQVVMFDVWCLVQYQHHLHPHRASSAWTISDQKHHLPHRLITIASCYCLPLLQLAIPVCVFLSGEPVTSEPGTLQHHQLVIIGCCLLLMWIDCCCQCLDRSYYPFGRLQHHQQPHLFL